jgi:hypothetical protein
VTNLNSLWHIPLAVLHKDLYGISPWLFSKGISMPQWVRELFSHSVNKSLTQRKSDSGVSMDAQKHACEKTLNP